MRRHLPTPRGTLGRLALLAVLVAGIARAEVGPAAEVRQHQLSVYTSGGAMFYLSGARTIGGAGGALGLRDTVQDRFILQADVSYLALIGNTFAVRVGAGLQRSGGLYAPAILVMLSTLFGDQFAFLTPEHPTAVTGPTLAVGVHVAPLRFTVEQSQLSLLELGVSVGTDLPGLGVQYHVNMIDIGIHF